MKVGTRLMLLATLAATAAFSGWVANQWSAARSASAMQQLQYANTVQHSVTRLNTRFGLYLSLHDERSLAEWRQAQQRLPSILAQRPESQSRYISSIRYQSNTLAQLSPLIGREAHDSPGQVQLASRIYATLQNMTDDALRLAATAEQRIQEASEQGRLISLGLMITLTLVLVLIAFPLANGLKSRLDRMRLQMQRVTAGNLWLSLDEHHKNDELGELARGFDTMLSRLRSTTVSVDQLNEEVERQTATLKQQQEYLQTLIEAEPACVLTIDRDDRILSLNSAGARMLRIDTDSAIGIRFGERFVAQEDRAAFATLIANAFDGQGGNLEYRLHRPYARQEAWLQTYAVPFYDRNGHAECIITVSHDISNRIREERRVREARSFLQNIVDSVGDAIVVRDIDCKVRLINRAARDSEPGHPCKQPLPKNLAASGHSAAQRMLMGSGRTAEVCTYMGHDGEWRHIERIATPLTQPDGTLNGVIELYRDITENTRLLRELHEEQARLKQLAHHDLLTGLPNRTLFIDRLEQTLLRARREQQRFALLFIDLDRFKEINDSLGHQAGDSVLRMAAQRLSQTIRASDTLARLGGDEFTVIMSPLPNNDDAALLAQKLIKCIEPPYQVDSHRLFITTSVGISVYPHDGNTTESLISAADAAMYKAKDDGKNVYRYYSQQLTRRAMEQVSLASELHRALMQDEFEVHYQPQFDLNSLAPIGMEALVRWQHPTEGLLMPARFLPIAEGSGLIVRIGNLVIDRVMQQTRIWHEQGLDPGVIAINLSGRQVDNERQLEWLEQRLERHRCRPEWFELEVTEDFLMQNPERAIAMFRRLRLLGFELAIDDFGTGFSSLSYLKTLPLTRLKIDRAFIDGLPGDSDDQAITRTIIALGQNLGLKVIAEGVETRAQLDFLRQCDCNEVQGFLLGKPQPPQSISASLRARGRDKRPRPLPS
ncbi:hypothetical protein GCM10011348_34800 [Marinobacterium nitratireducens]|uniref:Uncharacterized protein n=1 Tax=Marinobacterium nitratireducens TaxID=518897 RepID=A0A918DWG7_9GAMM|nr:EAL domain-containing protein [Marinobacterium nitratireducens]GGO85684.1 hypothetical protein GCM10011348_34800 [Marinobacterium nitratireducens]